MNNLKKIRKEKKLTQGDVAVGAGLSIVWVSFAEKYEGLVYKGLVSVLAKKKIADFLGMKIKEVFPEETREPKEEFLNTLQG